MMSFGYRRAQIVVSSLLLSLISAKDITNEGAIKVFKADITPLAGSHINVSGEVLVFVPPEEKFFGYIGYGGHLSNIQSNLDANDCPSRDGCGVRIHSGISCDDAETQGEHYFNFDEVDDPWLDEKYSSDSSGKAVFSSLISIGTNKVEDMPVVVYDELGFRIGCGILRETDPFEVYKSVITPMFDSGVYGEVLMYQKAIEQSSPNLPICYFGISSGLKPNIDCTNNELLDACGTHVHSGTSCNSFMDQGKSFYNSLVVNFNPWKELRYQTTDEVGDAQFMHCVQTGEANYEKKVFIIHNLDGSRAACGQLLNLAASARMKRLYISWILVAFLAPGVVLPFYFRFEKTKFCNFRKK